MRDLLTLITTAAALLATFAGLYVFVSRVLIPREIYNRALAEEDRLNRKIKQNDEEMLKFRKEREADLIRLATDEKSIQRLEDEVTELRSWRFGAQDYIAALERELRRHNIKMPDRSAYGINGDA